MAEKKEIKIKKFKNSNIDFWVGFQHWTIQNGKIEFVAGGIPTSEHEDILKSYVKRNKLL